MNSWESFGNDKTRFRQSWGQWLGKFEKSDQESGWWILDDKHLKKKLISSIPKSLWAVGKKISDLKIWLLYSIKLIYELNLCSKTLIVKCEEKNDCHFLVSESKMFGESQNLQD